MKNKFFYILPSFNEGKNIKSLLNKFNKFYKNKKILSKLFLLMMFNDNSLSILSKLKKLLKN